MIVRRKKLTVPQVFVLRAAARDGTVVLGGIDATPHVRRAVVYRLARMELLKWWPPHSWYEESQWKLTDKGRQALALIDQ